KVREDFASRATLERFALSDKKFDEFFYRVLPSIERQASLRYLKKVKKSFFLFLGALREADKVARFETPGGRGQHACKGNVVERHSDQAQVSDDVFDERVIEDGKVGDDKRNIALRKLRDEMIAVRVLTVKDGEIAPFAACSMDALKFGSD